MASAQSKVHIVGITRFSLERMMKRIIASWRRASLSLLPAALAADSALAATGMPDLASIDWQRTGLLAGSIALLAIVIALAMSRRRSAGAQDEGYLRRIGNMPAEPMERAEPPRRSGGEDVDARRRIESSLPEFHV